MKANQFITEIYEQLQYLFAFARQSNELDFVAGLSPEFRGSQDEGWNTTITAFEVAEEIRDLVSRKLSSKAELRTAYGLYVQLAEAGGFYEVLRNSLRVLEGQEYVLWPFQHLVKVRPKPKRVVGPNANAVFRDLSRAADKIGMTKLSEMLEIAFDDELRNAFAHADYVIWQSEIRIRNRNGGYAKSIPIAEFLDTLARGVMFFEVLRGMIPDALNEYRTPKTVVGKFSANFPMPWTLAIDPAGSFSISGSSPGPQTSPKFDRQQALNKLLGGRVIVAAGTKQVFEQMTQNIASGIRKGFDISVVEFPSTQELNSFLMSCDEQKLWLTSAKSAEEPIGYLISPFGVTGIVDQTTIDLHLPQLRPVEIVDAPRSEASGANLSG